MKEMNIKDIKKKKLKKENVVMRQVMKQVKKKMKKDLFMIKRKKENILSAEASDEANKEENKEGSIYDEEENSKEEDSEEGVIEMKGRRKICHIKTKVRAKTIRRLSDKRGIVVKEDSTPKGKKPRWSKKQRQLVFKEFSEELLAGKCPQRSKVMLFYNKYKHILQRNENVVFTFLHNIARGKQKVYTPDRLCYKK